MEVRFSKPVGSEVGILYRTVHACDMAVKLTSANGARVRFTLPEASIDGHDRVIRALLTLDPDATIRTSRAVYEGLASFEAQVKARVK